MIKIIFSSDPPYQGRVKFCFFRKNADTTRVFTQFGVQISISDWYERWKTIQMQDHSSFYQLIGTLGQYIQIDKHCVCLKWLFYPMTLFQPLINYIEWNDAKCVLELKGDEVKSPHLNRNWLYQWWKIWNDFLLKK